MHHRLMNCFIRPISLNTTATSVNTGVLTLRHNLVLVSKLNLLVTGTGVD